MSHSALKATRGLALLLSTILVACGGAADTPQSEGPPEVEADSVKTEPVEATPNAGFAVWRGDDDSCRWVLVDPRTGADLRTLVTIPSECWDVTISLGSGDEIMLQMGQALYRVNTSTGSSAALPAIPVEGGLDAAGYTEDGRPAIWVESYSEWVLTEQGGDVGIWSFQGKTTEVDLAYEPPLGYSQCEAYELGSDGAWTLSEIALSGLSEGMSPPFCWGDHIASEVLQPGKKGGHGAMLLEGIDPGLVTPAMEAAYVTRGFEVASGHVVAVRSDWFEGEIYMAPAFLQVQGGFVPLEGLQGEGGLDTFDSRDGMAIVCGWGSGGVYDLTTGSRLWESTGPCPIWWPVRAQAEQTPGRGSIAKEIIQVG